jgi:proteasome lid subunit RPN8/RPN11
MSYVSISKPVKDRIVQAARDTETEIIGLLLGKLQDDTIIIEDSTTHEFSSEPHRVTLPSSSMATIADQLVSGRLKGNIVGWYHSHTSGGLFFSETDISTQKKLQQFSSLITGLVVDSSNGEVGYFRVIPKTDKAIRIPESSITVYSDPKDATPLRQRPSTVVFPTPTVEVRRRPPAGQALTKRAALSIVLVVLIVLVVAFTGLILSYKLSPQSPVVITPNPVSMGIIGTPVVISANVTGPARNVTLVYGPETESTTTEALMNSVASREFSYVIPGNQVTGNIAYYIKAYDSTGKQIYTATYHISVADFNILPQISSLTVYRTRYAVTNIQLASINDFTQQIQLSTNGNPSGLTITFSRNPALTGTTVSLNVTAGSTAPNGTYPIVLIASYLPPQSPQVTRQTTLNVTVADFGLQIAPTSVIVQAGSKATFGLSLTLQKGFVDPVNVTLLNLPQGAKYTLTISNPTVLAGGPGTTTITLQITIPAFTKAGTYPILIEAVGGGLVHALTVQLTVR